MNRSSFILPAKFQQWFEWRPCYQPNTFVVLGCFFSFGVGLCLLSFAAFYTIHWVIALFAIVAGLIITPPFGLVSFRFLEFKVYVAKVRRCLSDGKAEYLMPGAFTHVVVHKRLPGTVILIKRGDEAMSRYIGRVGPRHTNESEWAMYQTMRELGLAVETKFLTRMRIRHIRLRFGSKIGHQASLKGEERFIADQQISEPVEIYAQARGLTLKEFLIDRGDQRRPIYEQLAELTRTMWSHGIVDLDVALRNYLIPFDEKGKPAKRHGKYQILCHDYSCVYELPQLEGRSILRWLSMYGDVGHLGKAAIDNGGCLMRSLSGRHELGVAQNLVPKAPWREIRSLYHQRSDPTPVVKRLRHHTSVPLLNIGKKAIAMAIVLAIRNRDRSRTAAD